MASMIAAEAGKKGSEIAAKALTGDIYTRRWTSVVGKGKKKKAVDHEVRVNALTLAIAAVGAASTAALGAGALWLSQKKLGRTDSTVVYRRSVSTPATTQTVVVKKGYSETYTTYTRVPGFDEPVPREFTRYIEPVTEERTVDGTTRVYTKNGMPIATKPIPNPSFEANTGKYLHKTTELRYVWTKRLVRDYTDAKGNRVRWWECTTTDRSSLGMSERPGFLTGETGDGVVTKIFDPLGLFK